MGRVEALDQALPVNLPHGFVLLWRLGRWLGADAFCRRAAAYCHLIFFCRDLLYVPRQERAANHLGSHPGGLLYSQHLYSRTGSKWSIEETWAFWVDKNFLIGRSGDWDPEGLLSGIPAIASCLLGVLAGMMMKDKSLADGKRLFLVWGVGCLVLGYVWSFHFPIIKVLWTSTFVLWAAGWSFLLLALFYWITDMIGWQKWAPHHLHDCCICQLPRTGQSSHRQRHHRPYR